MLTNINTKIMISNIDNLKFVDINMNTLKNKNKNNKKDQKIRFNNKINVILIPIYYEYHDIFEDLWYHNEDYQKFQLNYFKGICKLMDLLQINVRQASEMMNKDHFYFNENDYNEVIVL